MFSWTMDTIEKIGTSASWIILEQQDETLFMMALSFKALAAWTAAGVRCGWVDNDCKKVLSWRVGRNGSAGHDAAMVLSFWDILEIDMIRVQKEPAWE